MRGRTEHRHGGEEKDGMIAEECSWRIEHSNERQHRGIEALNNPFWNSHNHDRRILEGSSILHAHMARENNGLRATPGIMRKRRTLADGEQSWRLHCPRQRCL